MSKHARDRRPYIKPVTRIELSTESFTVRWILIVLLIAVAATCLVVGITSMMETVDGWAAIEVSSDKVNCSEDFQFYYDLGAGEEAATVENKRLTTIYSQATEDGYMIFSAYDDSDTVHNVRYLNQHPNEVVTVDETLYRALELLNRYHDRSVFLAPLNVEYNRIFNSTNDVEAAGFDPAKSEQARANVSEMMTYAGNPEMISLELFGDNQVQLHIAEEYLAYAQQEEIEVFVDFSWMTNAFIADYIAEVLLDYGMTNGYVVSFDGYTRNLDTRGGAYRLNVFSRQGDTVYVPAVMSYDEPLSIVSLRAYPMSNEDAWHYYEYENGDVASVFLDPADGLSKHTLKELISYSADLSCAETLMKAKTLFIADEVDMNSLNGNDFFCVWSEGEKIVTNDPNLVLEIQK